MRIIGIILVIISLVIRYWLGKKNLKGEMLLAYRNLNPTAML